MKRRIASLFVVVMTLSARTSATELANEILDATGIQGGLIVHLGCGDGRLTAGLRIDDRYLVHGLDRSDENVRKARAYIRSLGMYGNISIDQLTGKALPLADNIVNLFVSEDTGPLSMDEVLRVLSPAGVAYIKHDGNWTKTVKPRPEEIDQWTHYLYDASNNAVAHDTVVGPPRHVQWIGSPRWSRHHDRMASLSALVSAGGRIFYIFDEASPSAILLPQKRVLIARDAFSGVVLWKRKIPTWFNHLVPYKSGHAQLPRRLVAVGDEVYVTLGLEAPLVALDAATGEVVRRYKNTERTREVIASDGLLFVLTEEAPMIAHDYTPELDCMHEERSRVASRWSWTSERNSRVVAIQARTGVVRWIKKRPVVPLTLAANGKGLFFHEGQRIVRLDRATGEAIWESDPVNRRTSIPSSFGPTLALHKDVVLFSGGDRSQCALAAESGKILWTAKHPRSGHYSPEDLLVVDDLVWSGAIATGRNSGTFTGRDLHTGEIKREFPPDVETYWFHQRCYRTKATDRFLLTSRTGIEFVDVRSKNWEPHHWVRGGCIYGIMPCNGLVYAPPHSCACYVDAKMNGFCALAPAAPTRPVPREVPDADRLQRGPAYAAVSPRSAAQDARPNDWPTYRHDAARSGSTRASVPADLRRAWRTRLGGKLSSVVIGEGRLFVAAIDTHTVYALHHDTGKVLWSYTSGGRVDSPPTIYRGRVLFGCADGWVYCLRAADGTLAWRFRAAPVDRRAVAFEQLESLWPVSGSILVQDGVACCVAGRSMFLDGGLRLLRLDPETGRKISETILDDRDPVSGKNLQVYVKDLNMATALPDVLSSDGRHLYMRTQRFDLKGKRQQLAPTDVRDQEGVGVHLFSGIGFLDDTWFHRGYWQYGKSIASGANAWYRAGLHVPTGRLLVFDDAVVYGFGRKPQYFRWSTPLEYQLFAVDKNARTEPLLSVAARRGQRDKCSIPETKLAYRWSRDVSLQARAMVLAARTLFVAGPPDVLDEEEVFKRPSDPLLRPRLDRQAAALEGAMGAVLQVVSVADGRELARYGLESMPVFDGMAAAGGRLYLAGTDGTVLCLDGK